MNLKGRMRNEALFREGYEAEEICESTDYKSFSLLSGELSTLMAGLFFSGVIVVILYYIIHLVSPQYELMFIYIAVSLIVTAPIVAVFSYLIYVKIHNHSLARSKATAASIETFHNDIYKAIVSTKERRDNELGIDFMDESVRDIIEPEEFEQPDLEEFGRFEEIEAGGEEEPVAEAQVSEDVSSSEEPEEVSVGELLADLKTFGYEEEKVVGFQSIDEWFEEYEKRRVANG